MEALVIVLGVLALGGLIWWLIRPTEKDTKQMMVGALRMGSCPICSCHRFGFQNGWEKTPRLNDGHWCPEELKMTREQMAELAEKVERS